MNQCLEFGSCSVAHTHTHTHAHTRSSIQFSKTGDRLTYVLLSRPASASSGWQLGVKHVQPKQLIFLRCAASTFWTDVCWMGWCWIVELLNSSLNGLMLLLAVVYQCVKHSPVVSNGVTLRPLPRKQTRPHSVSVHIYIYIFFRVMRVPQVWQDCMNCYSNLQ